MLKLYGAAKSRGLRVLWMLGELGEKYDHKNYLPRSPETKTPEYRAINANAARADDRRRRLHPVRVDGDQHVSREEARQRALPVGSEERSARVAVEPVGDRSPRPPDRELRQAHEGAARSRAQARASPKRRGRKLPRRSTCSEHALAKSQWLAGTAFSVGDLNVASRPFPRARSSISRSGRRPKRGSTAAGTGPRRSVRARCAKADVDRTLRTAASQGSPGAIRSASGRRT